MRQCDPMWRVTHEVSQYRSRSQRITGILRYARPNPFSSGLGGIRFILGQTRKLGTIDVSAYSDVYCEMMYILESEDRLDFARKGGAIVAFRCIMRDAREGKVSCLTDRKPGPGPCWKLVSKKHRKLYVSPLITITQGTSSTQTSQHHI